MFDYGLILGIDPGTQQHNLGIALVDTDGKLVYCDEVPPLKTSWVASRTECVGMDALSDKLMLLELRFANAFHDIQMRLGGGRIVFRNRGAVGRKEPTSSLGA